MLLLASGFAHPQDSDTNQIPTGSESLPEASQEKNATTPNPELNPAGTEQPEATPPRPAPTAPPPYSSRSERDMQLLADSLSDGSAVWLEDSGEKFLTLFKKGLGGTTQGSVLLINAEGQHSHWPGTTASLRNNLAKFGWNTLALDLPPSEPLPVPQRVIREAPPAPAQTAPEQTSDAEPDKEKDASKEANNSEETAPEEAVEVQEEVQKEAPNLSLQDEGSPSAEPKRSNEEIATERLRLAVKFLSEKGQHNIVLLGNGLGALRAACYANSLADSGGIGALVMINARNTLGSSNQALIQCLAKPEISVLDIYNGFQQRDISEARQRLEASRRNEYKQYRQLHSPKPSHNTLRGENQLSRRVRGFLETQAKASQ